MSHDSQTFSHICTYHDHIQHEKKFVNMPAIVGLLVKKKLQSIYSKMYSFWDMSPLNGANTLLSNTICQSNKVCCKVSSRHTVYSRSQFWSSDHGMHKCEYNNMLLTFSDCMEIWPTLFWLISSRHKHFNGCSTTSKKHEVLHFYKAHLNADCPQTACTGANEDIIMQLWNKSCGNLMWLA
jgi:hypothetical protein